MFEEKRSCNGINFRYAMGRSIVSGTEIHSYNEILYYIGGDTTFLSERFSENLQAQTLIIIPRGEYHNFRVNDQDAYKRLVINFDNITGFEELVKKAMEKIRIIRNPGNDIKRTLDKICTLTTDNRIFAEAALYGTFLELLYEILINVESVEETGGRTNSKFISGALDYTHKHFTKNITAADLAEYMGVSESTFLNRFKEALGISFHRYITEKRMVYGRSLIESGRMPTRVFAECGYEDYSSFYKAYVKMFKSAPSKSRKG